MRPGVISGIIVVSAIAVGMAAASTDEVTMRAGSTVVRANESVELLGAVSTLRADEVVTVQGKECGVQGALRALGVASTSDAGVWRTAVLLRTTTLLRAQWQRQYSPPIKIRQRAYVALTARNGGRFDIVVHKEVGNVDGKRVVVERLTPAGWKRVRTVVVRARGYVGLAVKRGLRFAVPKGTTLRAMLPQAQAKPCYLAGYSKLIRT